MELMRSSWIFHLNNIPVWYISASCQRRIDQTFSIWSLAYLIFTVVPAPNTFPWLPNGAKVEGDAPAFRSKNMAPPQKNNTAWTSWWLNQPLWKICSSNSIISTGIGVKIKNIWNHQLVKVFCLSMKWNNAPKTPPHNFPLPETNSSVVYPPENKPFPAPQKGRWIIFPPHLEKSTWIFFFGNDFPRWKYPHRIHSFRASGMVV